MIEAESNFGKNESDRLDEHNEKYECGVSATFDVHDQHNGLDMSGTHEDRRYQSE